MSDPRIALIHATPLAMEPVAGAFARLWPQAQLANLLDDRLSQDLAAQGSITPQLTERMVGLAQYAKRHLGAAGILFTCSAFGPAIAEAARVVGIPTLKPNEAMFEDALALCRQSGPGARAGLVTTFAPAGAPMRAEFAEMAAALGQPAALDGICADGALEQLQAGVPEAHDRQVVQAARELSQACVLMLGQFSMARALDAVAAATGRPVLASPDSAVRKLQRLL